MTIHETTKTETDNIIKTALETNLPHFSGSETFSRWSILFPKFYLTEGAKYLAETAGAYWLMDVIASWQHKQAVRVETFQVWTMTVKANHEARIVCDDGNGNKLAVQIIPYTDFPFNWFKLYFCNQGSESIILLPGEY